MLKYLDKLFGLYCVSLSSNHLNKAFKWFNIIGGFRRRLCCILFFISNSQILIFLFDSMLSRQGKMLHPEYLTCSIFCFWIHYYLLWTLLPLAQTWDTVIQPNRAMGRAPEGWHNAPWTPITTHGISQQACGSDLVVVRSVRRVTHRDGHRAVSLLQFWI